MVSRLGSIAPEIEVILASASESLRVRAAFSVARRAIESAGVNHPTINAALNGDCHNELQAIVAAFDNEYFTLQEQQEAGACSKETVLAAFSRARAASAVAYACNKKPAEAIYEALGATDDQASVQQLALQVLNGQA
jgi:hypothetical protein